MANPHGKFGATELRESGDALDRTSVFEYRYVWRKNDGEILNTSDWVETDIPSRTETRPMVRRYDTEAAEKVYDKAQRGLQLFIAEQK